MNKHLLIIGVSVFVGMVIIAATAWRDYRAYPVRYSCALLIGGWHTDAPAEVKERCRKKGYPYDSSKTRN